MKFAGNMVLNPFPFEGKGNLRVTGMPSWTGSRATLCGGINQLKDLGVDQAALIGEPDPLTYGLGLIFTTFAQRLKEWFVKEIAE